MWAPLGQQYAAPAQFDRAQQINELLVAQPHCRPTNADRSLLEVGVRLQDGTLTSMRISLPPRFPGERPALSITSPVRHPWVDGVGRLSFPMLDRWGSPGIRLAAVVSDAFKGLGGTAAPVPSRPQGPPAAEQQQQQAGQPAAAPSAPLSVGGSGPASLSPAPSSASDAGGGGGGAAPPQRTRVPSVPDTFAEVAGMSEAELSRALTDEAAYSALVARLADSLNLWLVADKARGEARELAAANLARAEEQGEIRNQMAIIRSGEYAPARAAFDAKWARQRAVLDKLSPGVLLRRLQEAAKQAEEEGERLLGQLSGGQLGVEAFVEQYTCAQAAFHQRDLKLQAAQQTLPGAGPR